MDKLIVNDWSNYKFEFGDYFLFQKIEELEYDNDCYQYQISPPILGVFILNELLDMAVAINYIKWVNNRDQFNPINQSEIEHVIVWDDMIHILGYWKSKPGWKEILKSYRTYIKLDYILSNDIKWD